ncbi:hypothetical protein [Saccharothrix sp. NRRL B-16348]|uniref:hypothetical protein n=1 Tax=Saccharothrix sp. NRRL B-16348 TaxID=1415542 RepID=UPI0006AFEA27|nr:hypothetical protein [Saccharothrix sp. NRRL B-16348]
MTLTTDADLRQATRYECGCCREPIERSWNFVDRAGDRHAAYFANCYHHRDQPHDVWIDVILGTWDTASAEDHVTFGCRVGPVEGSDQPAATLVRACMDGSGGEVHGLLLSREAGLAHPRLPEFWQVVDFVLVNDPGVHAHLYG